MEYFSKGFSRILYYSYRWLVLFHTFRAIKCLYCWAANNVWVTDTCIFFALYRSNIFHRRFWYLLRLYRNNPLYVQGRQLHTQSQWNYRSTGYMLVKTICVALPLLRFSQIHRDIMSTSEKTPDSYKLPSAFCNVENCSCMRLCFFSNPVE